MSCVVILSDSGLNELDASKSDVEAVSRILNNTFIEIESSDIMISEVAIDAFFTMESSVLIPSVILMILFVVIESSVVILSDITENPRFVITSVVATDSALVPSTNLMKTLIEIESSVVAVSVNLGMSLNDRCCRAPPAPI